MKKYAFFITIWFLLNLQAQTNYTAIPDANFEAALSAYDDIAGDHQVPTAAIDTITVLNVESRNISDLTGIEDFAALTELRCGYNQLTSLDLSQNNQLELLMAPSNHLTSINVSQCPNLELLQVFQNQLSNLDISQNPNLYYLSLYNNQFHQIDVSNNSHLTYLYIANNQLTQLDVSQNTHLYRLDCRNNQLTQLDVSVNTNLWWIDCARNQISQLDVSNLTNLHRLEAYNNQLTSLNLDQNSQMDWLRLQNNQLTELHIQNGNNTYLDPAHFDLRNNPDLHCVFVDDVTWCSQNLTNIDPQTHFVTTQVECDSVDIDNLENNVFKIFPNPADNFLYFSTDTTGLYKIYNLEGVVLLQDKFSHGHHNIQLNNFDKGVYFIEIYTSNKLLIKSFIKN